MDDIAVAKGIEFGELLDEIEAIVYSGTKLNIDYFLEEIMDEDHMQDIYDYFKESVTDKLMMQWMNWVTTIQKTKFVWYVSSSFLKWLINHLFNDIVQLLVRGVPCKQLFYLIGMWYKKDVNCFFTF